MPNLEKLFEEILSQLQSESKNYKGLKICKYSFESMYFVFSSRSFFFKYFCYSIYNIIANNRYYKKHSKYRSTYCHV